MRRTNFAQNEFSSACSKINSCRGRRRLAFLLFGLGAWLTSFAQTFVAEWNAGSDGGVGPVGLALSTEGGATFLYVADQPRGRVLKLDTASGAVVATIGRQGTANGEFNSPYGIAFDPSSGDLYVAERGNNRISRVTKTGTFVMAWGSLGTADGQFTAPVGVAVDTSGDVYVTDHGNNRVQKFHVAQSGGTWSATHLLTWGSTGSGNGQFNQPYGITADAAGNIWVADGFNGRVQRFNTTGAYQATVGAAGTAPGQFVVATWVGLHPSGDLIVTSTNSDPTNASASDVNNQWVSRFTSAGAFVSRFGGTYGQTGGQFRLPFGAVVGPSNRLYVADYYNSRVQVFDLSGPPSGGGTDTTPPTVASFTTGATTATSVTFQITFSEPVTGVDAADFATVTTGGATASIGAVSGSGAAYSIPVSFTGTGTVQLNLKASGTGIADAANNAIATGATGPTFTIPTGGGGTGGTDTTPPTVASFTTGATTATSVTFQITFSEPVTGVDAADFATVTTGGATASIGAVSGSGAAYSIPVSFTGTGTVQLNLKASGTGIADAANNAIATGATGPTFTIPTGGGGGGTTTGTHVASITPPANGTYRKGQELTFVVRFSGNVSVVENKGDGAKKAKSDDDDEEDDDEGSAFFTWTSVGSGGGHNLSGKVTYRSGTGTSALTFRYKVKNGDLAPSGIVLATAIQLDDGTTIRDATGVALSAAQLALPWAQNPLSSVILDAPKTNNGVGNGNGNNGNNGKGNDRLSNLSSRLRVTGGDASRSVVAGFVVSGTAPKPILIRGIGPGLAGFGIRDSLAQPRLVLRDSTGKVLAENDGWDNRLEITLASERVGAFKLTPGSKDAALLVALAPGAYTAQVFSNGNGVTLIEVYDASTGDALSTEQIVNISTRGFVGAGEDNIVAGFVITGNSPRRVLVRGVGPGLAALGVSGALVDPVLKLYASNSSAAVAQNDNWQTAQPINGSQTVATATEISTATTSVGAFPLAAGSKDAAILITLAPGNYTAVMTGANNATGAALIEIYEVQ